MWPVRSGSPSNLVPAIPSSPRSVTTARAISPSCSILISFDPRDFQSRNGWNENRQSKCHSNKPDRESSMPTECLFREDAYLKTCDATVVGVTDRGGIVLDRTVFYATSGGQPGDNGVLTTKGGVEIPIATVVYTDPMKTDIAHVPADSALPLPAIGETVEAAIGWDRRYARMRMHTALHLLSAALPYPVTGGSVGEAESRLDFDIPEGGLDKDEISAKLAEMIAADAEVRSRWISDDELAANPGLVKTMSVKPPMGTGRVRLIEIVGLDLQPCGGTHVRRTAEIGAVRVTQIEKKGKLNRRVRIAFA